MKEDKNIYLMEDLENDVCTCIGILSWELFTPMVGDEIIYKGHKYKVNTRELMYNYNGDCSGLYLIVEKVY